ncbi:MAG: riboflavin synthase [Candidatus Brocadiaceae bacterium]|jgi:riboflavin synthase
MFTGIIQEVGSVAAVRRSGSSCVLSVESGGIARDATIGDSVSVEGVCLTVTAADQAALTFDVGAETLRRTTLGELRTGDRVNLEPALRVGDRLGGHFVSGHVDGVGTIQSKDRRPGEVCLAVEAPTSLTEQMVMKGSVAVDGISLTIASLGPGRFEVSLIPHTLAATTLEGKGPGDRVNIECDMIGRWVRRVIQGAEIPGGPAGGLSIHDMEDQGF